MKNKDEVLSRGTTLFYRNIAITAFIADSKALSLISASRFLRLGFRIAHRNQLVWRETKLITLFSNCIFIIYQVKNLSSLIVHTSHP